MDLVRKASKVFFGATSRLMPRPPGPRILIYHHVGEMTGLQMEVSTENFERQVRWLIDNKSVVDLESAVTGWTEAGSEQRVVLTFDDGYSDLFEVAFPILKEHQLPFVLYLDTEHISDPAQDDRLSWEQVRAMLDSGLLTLGAHTRTHPDMRTLTEDQALQEVLTSNEEILERTGVIPKHFAYPYGFWSAAADAAVRDHYLTATLGGSTRPEAHPDPHLLHRYPVQASDGFAFFKSRVEQGMGTEEFVRRKLKGYDGP